MYSRILYAAFIYFLSMMVTMVLCIPAFAGPAGGDGFRLPEIQEDFNTVMGDWLGGYLARLRNGVDKAGGAERPAALTGFGTDVTYSLYPLVWRTGPERGDEPAAEEVDSKGIESLSVHGRYHFGEGALFIPYAGMSVAVARVPGWPGQVGGWANGLGGAYSTAYAYQGGLGVKSLLAPNLVLGLGYRYRLAEEGAYGVSAGDRGAHKFLLGIDYRY